MLKIKRKPDSKSIAKLIADIEKERICLPDFQREFVWNEKQCAKLIESVLFHYPIGTLMFLNADVNRKFGARSFKGQNYRVSAPSYFVIDGQQRLNTFYQFLRRPPKFEPLDPIEFKGRNIKLFLKLDGIKEYNLDKPTLIVPRKIEKEDMINYVRQGKERLIPLEFVLYDEYSKKWVSSALNHLKSKTIKKYLKKIENIRDVLNNYFCFVEVVESKLDSQDHYNIFQLLNSAGTDLTLFDELVAKLNPLGVNLRNLWKSSQYNFPELKNYDIDPAYIIKTIALIRATKDQINNEERHSCTKKDLPKLYKIYEKIRNGANEFNHDWNESCKYIEKALKVIKSEYGVYYKKYVPYYPMIIMLASILWWFEKYKKYDSKYRKRMYNKLKKWYWGSILYSEYDSQTDNIISNHYLGLRKWLSHGTQKTPSDVNFPLSKKNIVEFVEDIDSSADARYKGIICLPLIGMNARDIFSSDFLINSKLHDHHIFPVKFLRDNEITDRELINNLGNRMLITDSTNQKIKKKSPYIYLHDVSSAELKKYFISKSIIKNKLLYNDFLEDRKHRIVQFIYDYINY